MKLARWMNTAVLFLFVGTFPLTTALVRAQDQSEPSPRPEEAKPSKQPSKQNEDKPAKHNADPRTAQEGEARKGQSAEHAQGSAGRRGGHIPDDKFRASFGRQHTFVMQRSTVAQGQPTFQYGGYSFTVVDAWPVDWAYTDECYIDYVDGEYFLFDLAHPGVRLAIVVVL